MIRLSGSQRRQDSISILKMFIKLEVCLTVPWKYYLIQKKFFYYLERFRKKKKISMMPKFILKKQEIAIPNPSYAGMHPSNYSIR
jgi:hypothetical protein